MRTKRVTLGVLFAVVLCMCGLGASSASAMTWEECVSNGLGGTGANSCGAGNEWKGIVGEQTVIGTSSSALTIGATIAGVSFDFSCTGSVSTGKAQNSTPLFSMKATITGTKLTPLGCKITTPAGKGCTMPEEFTTNSLKGETVEGTMKQKYVPTEGTTIATFTVSGGAECPAALKGSKSLTGSITSELNEATGEQEFTATSGSELKYAGQTATYTAKEKFETENKASVVTRTP